MITPDLWQVESPRCAGAHVISSRAYCERWLATPYGASLGGTAQLVMSPACGCCGRTRTNGSKLAIEHVAVIDGQSIFRCEKHVGRAPCCIEGCGKTYAFKPEQDYSVTMICGKHWREAPLRDRRLYNKIRAKAKRIGWTDQLIRVHDKVWARAIAAVRAGRVLDMDEINKMFGWAE